MSKLPVSGNAGQANGVYIRWAGAGYVNGSLLPGEKVEVVVGGRVGECLVGHRQGGLDRIQRRVPEAIGPPEPGFANQEAEFDVVPAGPEEGVFRFTKGRAAIGRGDGEFQRALAGLVVMEGFGGDGGMEKDTGPVTETGHMDILDAGGIVPSDFGIAGDSGSRHAGIRIPAEG